MRESKITRDEAFELLKKYNKDPFHIRHALTVEGVMRWYAKELGYADEEEYWGIVGLLHDIDFELYPEEHCKKAPELLKAGGVGDDMIYSICSHGYGICVDIEPVHEMEKVLFAVDELTGLIGAACAGVMLQVIAGITSASQEDSILMKFSWDGAISWRGIILALVLLVFTRYIKKTKDLHPIVFIGVSAVIGVVFHFAGV